MAKVPTVDVLLNRFRDEVHSVFYPFLVVAAVDRLGTATKEEIREEIFLVTQGTMQQEPLAHSRLVGRIEKTFRLIEPAGKTQSSDVCFQLTAKGRQLYDESVHQIVSPLVDALKME